MYYIVYRDFITTLIIGVLHFTIMPISTFSGAFVSEIQYTLKIRVFPRTPSKRECLGAPQRCSVTTSEVLNLWFCCAHAHGGVYPHYIIHIMSPESKFAPPNIIVKYVDLAYGESLSRGHGAWDQPSDSVSCLTLLPGCCKPCTSMLEEQVVPAIPQESNARSNVSWENSPSQLKTELLEPSYKEYLKIRNDFATDLPSEILDVRKILYILVC